MNAMDGEKPKLEDIAWTAELFEPVDAGRALHDPLLVATTDLIKRRLWTRRTVGGLLVLLVFSCGVAVGKLSSLESGSPGQAPPAAMPGLPVLMGAEQAEIMAELASADERPDLFRKAGDAYAAAGAEGLEGAIRCYGQSLRKRKGRIEAGRSADHWLRLALAQARDIEGGGR